MGGWEACGHLELSHLSVPCSPCGRVLLPAIGLSPQIPHTPAHRPCGLLTLAALYSPRWPPQATFAEASSFTSDLNSWDVSRVTSMVVRSAPQ